MAALLNSESRRLYSWWWDSHNTPKNSKWLHENLTDMDGKVKTMIKLIEEDADSFRRKAEMYYEKRPELMKFVEEFYRAYRALAERYDHATGELRHAHRTLAKAFPDQLVPSELLEDSPPESLAQERERAMQYVDDLFENLQEISLLDIDVKGSDPHNVNSEGGLRKRDWKQLPVNEVHSLKKALTDVQAEKVDVLLQYQQCLQKLSKMEEQLNKAQEDSSVFNEKVSLAEIEFQTLKEALIQLETEKNAGSLRHIYYFDKISDLEAMVSQLQEQMKGLDIRAVEAESKSENLKDEMSRLMLEKDEVFKQLNQCLSNISNLESIVSVKEDEIRVLKKQAERAVAEVSELKRALADLNEEKEGSTKRYKCCLETILRLEKDLASAKDDVKCLNNEVLVGNAKLMTVEGKCTQLELSNQKLHVEADNLGMKITIKDQELLKKQEELEKLQNFLQDEHKHHAHVEAPFQSLQDLHSQSQGDQKGLVLELENMLQMLKGVESSKMILGLEIQQVRNENQSLNQANSMSAASMENMQNEIICLKEIKMKLDKELSHHMGMCTSLQQEILHLKEEINSLNRSYQALLDLVKMAGLNPECIMTSMKSLLDENSSLRETCEQGSNEKELLLNKLWKMEEVLTKTMVVESSLSEFNSELEDSHEKVEALQESFWILQGEKTTLVGEKASLLSQLQSVTENMYKLEKNAVLENSLSTAKVELEGLREKSKGLEEICELLKNERSYLMTERDSLVSKLQHVEGKLENMERRYMGLEEKYASLQKEKEAMHCQVDKLEVALGIEKQERTSSQDRSETKLAGLENQMHLLQEENRWKKKESEEELEKSLKAQFELSVLQKFTKDTEEKNYSLIIECQKHVEASKLAERVISELESESLEQQVEAELLLDEIERLRLGIYQIFRSLENVHVYTPPGKDENEHAFVHYILESIDDMKCSISEQEDEKQQLIVENSVLVALLKQLESWGMDIVSQKVHLEQEFEVMAKKFAAVKNKRDELQGLNKPLKSDVSNSREAAAVLEAELASLCAKQADLQSDYYALQEAYSQVNQENASLLKKCSELEEEKHRADLLCNDAVIREFWTTATQYEVLRNFGTEKVVELKLLLEDLNRQHEVNNGLGTEVMVLRQKLELQNAGSLVLKDAVCSMENEIQEMREFNVQMNWDLENREEKLINIEATLLDAEMKLEAAEELHSTLCKTVADLKNEIQHSQQMRESLETDVLLLSEENAVQKEEIKGLQMVNENLESELGQLHQEMEENMMRELTLNTELQGMNYEFEVWEAEASTFCFDLQVSSMQEVLLKDKVQELTRECKTLENEHTSKSLELEEMKGKIQSKDSEINELKSLLSAYAPIIVSLRDDITILENSVLPQTKLKAVNTPEPEFLVAAASEDRDSFQLLPEDQSLINLKELQKRVKAVRKMMEETNKPVLLTGSYRSSIEESALSEGNWLTPNRSFGRDKNERSRKKGLYSSPKLQKSKSRISQGRNGSLLMKDIPLDHVSELGMFKRGNVGSDDMMLELWETTEYVKAVEPPFAYSDMEKELGMDCTLDFPAIKTEPSRQVSDRKILERLASDAKKLEILQSTLDILREKWESNKTSRKKAKNADYTESVNEQLLEAEDTLIQLMDLNGQLVNHIELCPRDEMASPRMKETVNTWMMKVMEQADKGAERIGRLQLELQKIQYSLLKLMDDKVKGRNRFFRNRSIILRDFVNSGRKNSRRRKKSPNCECFRQSASGKVNSL